MFSRDIGIPNKSNEGELYNVNNSISSLSNNPINLNFKNASFQTELLTKRNCTICVNIFCPSVTEYPLNFENCPQCNKRLSKTISGANNYILKGENTCTDK